MKAQEVLVMKSKPPIKQAENHLSIEDTCQARSRIRDASQEDSYYGAMTAKRPPRKKDLRKLGEWIKRELGRTLDPDLEKEASWGQSLKKLLKSQ